MTMPKLQTKSTKMEQEKHGWIYLLHDDAYNLYFKTFIINEKPKTIVINDWSSPMITIHDYDMKDITINDEWEEVWAKQEAEVAELEHLKFLLTLQDYINMCEVIGDYI